MIDPSHDKLQELYGIDAEYQDVNALVDKLSDGTPADFGCEIYKSKDGTHYAVVTSKHALPNDKTVLASLDDVGRQYPEEYDVRAEYVSLEPTKPQEGFRVYRLEPYTKEGKQYSVRVSG
jgi:hypothetical protein